MPYLKMIQPPSPCTQMVAEPSLAVGNSSNTVAGAALIVVPHAAPSGAGARQARLRLRGGARRRLRGRGGRPAVAVPDERQRLQPQRRGRGRARRPGGLARAGVLQPGDPAGGLRLLPCHADPFLVPAQRALRSVWPRQASCTQAAHQAAMLGSARNEGSSPGQAPAHMQCAWLCSWRSRGGASRGPAGGP